MQKFIIGLFILCLATSGAFAATINLDSETRAATGVTIVADAITHKVAPAIQLQFHVSSIEAVTVETPQGNFTNLVIPRFHASEAIGAPNLPVMNRLVEVPLGAELSIKVLESDYKEYTFDELGIKHPLMPRQPSHPKDGTVVPFAYEEAAYMHKGYQSEELARVEDLGLLRHMRLAFVKIAPVAYDPLAQKIKVYTNVVVEISMKNANMAATGEMKTRFSSPVFQIVEDKVLRTESLKALDSKGAQGYLIVSDRMFEKDLKEFVAWKTKKGFKTEVLYTDTVGDNMQEGIKNAISKRYNEATKERPAPSYVLFVGDHNQIPAFKGTTGSHISDLYYLTVTKGDNIPDILSGRFSARNSEELKVQIDKTLEYEMYKMPDPSFLNTVVMIAGWDYSHAVKWGYPQLRYGLKYYFNEAHGIEVQNVFLSAGSHQNESAIKAALSKGSALVNYTAHGSSTTWADPSLTISDINKMGNKSKYPLVIGNCCLTNKFEVSTCFGEGWLRAKEQGALGYIGGSNSTYWDEDLWWGCGFYPIPSTNAEGTPPTKEETGIGAYDGVFEGGYSSNAAMMLIGNLAVQESSSPRKLYYWEVYHLMGDPAVSVYYGVPGKMAVKMAKDVEAKATSFSVDAPNGATVAISQNGTLLGAAVAENGTAVVELAGQTAGLADVVITRANAQPYFGSVTVK